MPQIKAFKPNWKGGITPQDHLERCRFGHSVRRQVFQRDGFKCIACGAGGFLHVDHIKGWATDPALRFDLDNCRTLCVPCHYRKTFGKDPSPSSKWGKMRDYSDNANWIIA